MCPDCENCTQIKKDGISWHLPFSKIAVTRSFPSRLTLSTSILCKSFTFTWIANICTYGLKIVLLCFDQRVKISCVLMTSNEINWEWKLFMEHEKVLTKQENIFYTAFWIFFDILSWLTLAMYWKFASHCFAPRFSANNKNPGSELWIIASFVFWVIFLINFSDDKTLCFFQQVSTTWEKGIWTNFSLV